ncbi:MAG: hypothetical protein ABH824_03370 [Nanoarchaeota archaeon]|nr:hypothetical protein [Nanoarchaeota archaeon]MBU1632056.1 hypothetical protein [Nanoarchaeota archaeon]MBU1875817.1 hypothetical protein [Nanoarchaeota archaeon]
MKKLLLIRKEITILHLLILLTGKLFIGLSIGLMFSDLAFPWSYPILFVGVLIFLPGIYYLFKEETEAEISLESNLKNKTNKKINKNNKIIIRKNK